MKLRDSARLAALSSLFLWYKATGRLSAGLSKNRIQFLYLHHVFPDEEESFRGLLKILSRNHKFISYSEAVSRVQNGPADGRYLAFSFDDGLKNCLKAAEILKEFGAAACFFVCPSVLGENDSQKAEAFCREKLHLPPVSLLTWENAEMLLKEGHEIGNHTMTHADLARVAEEEVREEISKSRDALRARLGEIRHFSWPYGKFENITPSIVERVFQTGHQSCASAVRGCHVPGGLGNSKKTICLRRDHVMAQWPAHHLLYFLARNALAAAPESSAWPRGWFDD